MKRGLLAFVGSFCIASLIAFGAYAKGKPDKPGRSETEWIAFTGDWIGGETVEGCCPNGGPFPSYQLIVTRDLGANPDDRQVFADIYSGFLFMNRYGREQSREYLVQFWGVSQSNRHIAIEIIGVVIDEDKNNTVTTVIFESEDCVHLRNEELHRHRESHRDKNPSIKNSWPLGPRPTHLGSPEFRGHLDWCGSAEEVVDSNEASQVQPQAQA